MTTSGPELMLRRLSVEEALVKLDQGLTDAYVAGLHSVVVIHGKGGGVLRQAVRRELSRHSLVEAFRPADPREGGAGGTVVTLAKK